MERISANEGKRYESDNWLHELIAIVKEREKIFCFKIDVKWRVSFVDAGTRNKFQSDISIRHVRQSLIQAEK